MALLGQYTWPFLRHSEAHLFGPHPSLCGTLLPLQTPVHTTHQSVRMRRKAGMGVGGYVLRLWFGVCRPRLGMLLGSLFYCLYTASLIYAYVTP